MKKINTCYRSLFLMLILFSAICGRMLKAQDIDELTDRYKDEISKIQSSEDSQAFFLTHVKDDFGLTNNLLGFLNDLEVGKYSSQIDYIMQVPVQQWNPNAGPGGWGRWERQNALRIVNKNRRGSLPYVKNLMSEIGDAMAIYSIGNDIVQALNGDDNAKLKALHGTYEFVAGRITSNFPGMGTAMMGVAFISYALNKFISTTLGEYSEYWWQKYRNYYLEKYPSFVEDWADLATQEGGFDIIEQRLEEEFWNSDEAILETDDAPTLYSQAEYAKNVMGAGFAAEYYRDYLQQNIESWVQTRTEQGLLGVWSEYRNNTKTLQETIEELQRLRELIQYAEEQMAKENPVAITVTPAEVALDLGESITFTALAIFEDESTRNITELEEVIWSIGSPVLNAVEAGEQVVTVTYRGLSAEALVIIDGEEVSTDCGDHGAWSDTEQRCICDDGYELNDALGKCINLEAAIEELTDDSEADLCDESVFEEKMARLNELAASGNRMVASFITLYNQFMKEVNDQNSNLCGNSMIAYTYAVSKDLFTDYEALTDDITDLSTDILSEGAFCPDRDTEADFASITPILSQAGSASGQMERGIVDMENELMTFGCDVQEVEDQGNVIADQTTNPEVIASGGVGSFGTGANPGVPGGPGSPTGDTDGIIILSYGVNEYAPQSSVSVGVTLNRDNFNLSTGRNSTDYQFFQNLSLEAGDQIRINTQGVSINPSITLRQTDFGWIDPNTGSTVSPGNGKKIFSLTIAIFYDDDEDEMRYRMTVILGQGGFGYPGTPGGGRTFEY